MRGFALSCLNFGLERGYPVYLGTKNTELEHYDGLFKNAFQDIYDSQFRKRFEAKGIHFEHRMVDELAAFAIKSSGGFVWACNNYDGAILALRDLADGRLLLATPTGQESSHPRLFLTAAELPALRIKAAAVFGSLSIR